MSLRNLVLVLGDQLEPKSAVFDNFDVRQDQIWTAELPQEPEHVWSHKVRITLFLSAMRHFADILKNQGISLRYLRLGEHPYSGFAEALGAEIARTRPQQ